MARCTELWRSERDSRHAGACAITRYCRNTRSPRRDVRRRFQGGRCPLVVTDAFEFHKRVAREALGPKSPYCQVIETRRSDTGIQVERERIPGARWKSGRAPSESGDSSTLDTSFVDRLNLTIRQVPAYLSRRTLLHWRRRRHQGDHPGLLRRRYHYGRARRALRFGKEMRTPAMQGGLAKRPPTRRDASCSRGLSACSKHPSWSRSTVKECFAGPRSCVGWRKDPRGRSTRYLASQSQDVTPSHVSSSDVPSIPQPGNGAAGASLPNSRYWMQWMASERSTPPLSFRSADS